MSNPQLIYKSAPATYKADAGTMEGYASTYLDVDRAKDRIMPGAFGTEPFNIPLFAYHEYPVGGAVCTPDAKGLHVKGTLANTAAAQDVRELMKVGGIPSMSFGFDITKSEPNEFGGLDIYGVDTMEVSAVPIPCNPAATVLAVKAFGADAIKEGRRNSETDQKNIQTAHDALVNAGADCGQPSDGDGKAWKSDLGKHTHAVAGGGKFTHQHDDAKAGHGHAEGSENNPKDADLLPLPKSGPVGVAPAPMEPPSAAEQTVRNMADLAQAFDQLTDNAIQSLDAGHYDEVDAILSALAVVSDQQLAVLGVADPDEEDE